MPQKVEDGSLEPPFMSLSSLALSWVSAGVPDL